MWIARTRQGVELPVLRKYFVQDSNDNAWLSNPAQPLPFDEQQIKADPQLEVLRLKE